MAKKGELHGGDGEGDPVGVPIDESWQRTERKVKGRDDEDAHLVNKRPIPRCPCTIPNLPISPPWMVCSPGKEKPMFPSMVFVVCLGLFFS